MTRKKISSLGTQGVVDHTPAPGLVSDIRLLIGEAKAGLAASVNGKVNPI